MDSTYKYLVECVQDKKIDRQIAIDLIKLLEGEEKADVKDIAVIGMAAKLPTIEDIQGYWDVIASGVDCIAGFPESRSHDINGYLSAKGMALDEIQYIKSAYLADIDKFDYKFFKLSPREASLMDPSQRLFLETCWQAIEDAGYGGNKLEGTNTAVYAGFASNLRDMYARLIEELDQSGLSISLVGNLTAVIPSRISYLLDLKGPSMVVDTACSSSLVAIDMACQALRNHACELAIAGGININTVPLDKEYMQTGIESSDGLSRTFDDLSDGSGVGEGVGAILLKPLQAAIRDKDHIYAVIKGSAMNQDGRAAGITAPNPQAQAEVILKAWENAAIDPETIAYIETHGTGTNLGDPIEIQGISSAFRGHTNKKQFCAVSSVKTNIGHLSEAAGIISIMKAIMALNAKQLPPSINFNKPNRSIAFEDSPVYVNTKLRPWLAGDEPRRCGVSAFGISGTNCHIVLEEAPAPQADRITGVTPHLFTLSAKSKEALQQLITDYIAYLADNEACSIDEICYTANSGRGHYAHRLALLPDSIEDLRLKLIDARLDAQHVPAAYGYHRLVDSNKEALDGYDLTIKERDRLSAEAAHAIADYWADPATASNRLVKVCNRYIRGAEVDWELLAGSDKPAKIPLPVYPFERSRCWVQTPDVTEAGVEVPVEPTSSGCLHVMNWIQEPLEESGELIQIADVLVIKDSSSSVFVQNLIDKLRIEGHTIIEVTIEQAYERIDSEHYTISDKEEDYNKLISAISSYDVTHILHMCGLTEGQDITSISELEECQSKGIYSLLYLTRSLLTNDKRSNTYVLLFTSQLHSVTDTDEREPTNPHYAPLVGLGKVVTQEYSQLICKAIDVDSYTSVEIMVPELMRFTKQYQACYRQGQRYVEQFGPLDLQELASEELVIKRSGVYMITGGTGGIGLETAKYIATKNNEANIALINRSPFPPSVVWDRMLEEDGDPLLVQKIHMLQELEAMGADVIIISADVADLGRMTEVVGQLREQYGRINGVIHGAGIAGAGYLIKKDLQIFNNVLKPKVAGTWILDYLTREDELDFFIMQSSGVSLVGEAGQGDYVAGNSYLDAFATYRRSHDRHALTINWVSWKEAGMSVKFGINVDSFFKALPTQLAIQSMDAVLERNVSNVVIGEVNESPEYLALFAALPFHLTKATEERYTSLLHGNKDYGLDTVFSNGNYDAAIIDKGKLIILPKGKESAPKSRSSKPVTLIGKQGEGYSATEQQLAAIFSEILGYSEIDIHDSLFELGGDSLLLMRIQKLVDKQFPDKVTVTDMFEFPSVDRLAMHIHKQEEATVERSVERDFRQEARDIFGKLAQGSMSIEDAIHVIEDL